MTDTIETLAPHRAVRAPGLGRLMMEARAPFEFAASIAAAPVLLRAPRGDGHPVLVYPGFMATDMSTRPLRRLLRTLGHDVAGWEQGRNLGPRDDTLARAHQHIVDVQRHHRPPSSPFRQLDPAQTSLRVDAGALDCHQWTDPGRCWPTEKTSSTLNYWQL